MVLFYGRQFNGTMKETAIKSTFIFKGFMLYCKPAKKSSPNSKKSYRQKKSIAKQRRQSGSPGRLK